MTHHPLWLLGCLLLSGCVVVMSPGGPQQPPHIEIRTWQQQLGDGEEQQEVMTHPPPVPPRTVVREIKVPSEPCLYQPPTLLPPPVMDDLSDPSIVTQQDVEALIADHINELNLFIETQQTQMVDAYDEYVTRCGL